MKLQHKHACLVPYTTHHWSHNPSDEQNKNSVPNYYLLNEDTSFQVIHPKKVSTKTKNVLVNNI